MPIYRPNYGYAKKVFYFNTVWVTCNAIKTCLLEKDQKALSGVVICFRTSLCHMAKLLVAWLAILGSTIKHRINAHGNCKLDSFKESSHFSAVFVME